MEKSPELNGCLWKTLEFRTGVRNTFNYDWSDDQFDLMSSESDN